MAVGNATKTLMLYNGNPIGNEVHMAAGGVANATVNTTSISRSFRGLERISVDAITKIDQLPFTIMLEDKDGNTTIYKPSAKNTESAENTENAGNTEAPLYLVVNGDKQGKWFWAKEDVNIGVAYPQFSTWASNVQSYIDWYDRLNASSKVITY